MKKHLPAVSRTVVLFAIFALMPLACSDDDPVKPRPTVQPARYYDLTQKWHVLNNIEVAYNKRELSKYDQVLDANFTFILSPDDVGGTNPAEWGRADELLYNSRLFDLNYSGAHRCKKIDMDIVLPDNKNQLAWVEITPASAPDETWYSTTVFYQFHFDVEPDTQFLSAKDAKAEFTVRNAGTDDAPRWQLVEMRDLAKK